MQNDHDIEYKAKLRLFVKGYCQLFGCDSICGIRTITVHLTVFSNIFLYFNLEQKQFLQTMLAIHGFHSEYFFWKNLMHIKNLQF